MKRFFAAALCAATLALAGCHHADPASPPAPVADTPPAPRDKVTIYVVNPKAAGADDALMPRTVRLAHPESPAREAVTALIAAPGSPMPRGLALRGLVLSGGVATLDFSRSPVDETGGEGHQTDTLTALSRTLGQFPEITSFQVQVKGKLVQTFGEYAADGPIPVERPSVKAPHEAAP